MFKTGIMLLTVCLFAGPTFAQDDPKGGPDSEAAIKELRESLAKSQAALKASQAAETKARQEAEEQRDRAQKLQYAAQIERAHALDASNVAEIRQLEAIKQAEQAKASADAAAQSLKAKEPDAKERKGKRGGKRKANIAALEKQVELLTRQMQDVQAELKALRDQISGEPGNKFREKGGAFQSRKSVESFDAPLETNPFKENPIKDPKSSKEAGLPPGKASN